MAVAHATEKKKPTRLRQYRRKSSWWRIMYSEAGREAGAAAEGEARPTLRREGDLTFDPSPQAETASCAIGIWSG
jgi:hypothetical protein